MGCVTVLTEILSVVYPAAFSRSFRIKHYVALVTKALGMRDVWQFEAAAILSQIGCITLPLGTTDKVYAGAELSAEESRLFARHPLAAAAFLRRFGAWKPRRRLSPGSKNPTTSMRRSRRTWPATWWR